ncbi:MAG: hypothetical protein QW734_01090 [Candidatus Bathyarchaeia archaeon]
MADEQKVEQTQEQEQEWTWTDYSDWASWSAGTEKRQPETAQAQSELEERLKRLEQLLQQQQQQAFYNWLADQINNAVRNAVVANPILGEFADDIRAYVSQRLTQWYISKWQEVQANPEKASELSIDKIASVVAELVNEKVRQLDSILSKYGIGGKSPMSLPGTGGVAPYEGMSVSSGAPAVPGHRIPINEEMELYLVPEDYIDREIRQKQLKEWIKDRIALEMKRRQGVAALQSSEK